MGGAYSAYDARNAYRVLIGKLVRKLTLGRPWHIGKQNIQWDVTEIVWKNIGPCWINLVQDSAVL
jgi:hypothetical protein